MYGWELIIMITATFGLAISGGGAGVDVIGITIFWRFILGLGVGGDYPSSAIIMAELAPKKSRGAMMATVFAGQGFGQITAALVSFICIRAFSGDLQVSVCQDACISALDRAWRIVYGFGIIPACIGLYFRLTVPETPRFTLDVRDDDEGALYDATRFTTGNRRFRWAKFKWGMQPRVPRSSLGRRLPPAGWKDFKALFRKRTNAFKLAGVALSWFCLDVAFVKPVTQWRKLTLLSMEWGSTRT
jgi:MFS transporter, PHS family, inorganic phosphate transporter